jgi:hypothetical protein
MNPMDIFITNSPPWLKFSRIESRIRRSPYMKLGSENQVKLIILFDNKDSMLAGIGEF